ncbi:alpha/beta hydrolase family protein, partial [Paenibacillus sonchi]
AILGYAALSQETADMCQPGMPSPINDVDKDTCPFFLFATRDDSIVPVQDTVDFEKALLDNGIMFESHIYAYGMHGFSTGESYLNPNKNCNRVSHWVQDSIEWLKDVFGTLQADGLGAPACSGKVSGDWDEMLSADCTMAHLRKQPVEVQQLLTEVIAVLDAIVAQKTGKGLNMTPFFKNIKLRDLMTMIGQPESAIEQIDAALQQRSNVR